MAPLWKNRAGCEGHIVIDKCGCSNQTNFFKILSPLEHVPIVIGIGLNYKKHAEEAGVRIR